MIPETFELAGPVVEGLDGVGVGLVEHLAAIAAHANEADFAEDAEMLGDGRLLEAEGDDDVANGALLEGEIGEDVAAARFGDGVEGVGGGGGTRHGGRIHTHMGICQGEIWEVVERALIHYRGHRGHRGKPKAKDRRNNTTTNNSNTNNQPKTHPCMRQKRKDGHPKSTATPKHENLKSLIPKGMSYRRKGQDQEERFAFWRLDSYSKLLAE